MSLVIILAHLLAAPPGLIQVLFSKRHCAERATDAHLRLRKLRRGRALGHPAEHGLESVLHKNSQPACRPLRAGLC